MSDLLSAPTEVPPVPDHILQLRDAIRRFIQHEVRPVEQALPADARGIPAEAMNELRRRAKGAGYWMLQAPREFGGGGLSAFEGAVIGEEVAKHTFSFGTYVFGQEPPNVLYSGSPEQIERYVKPTIEHGWQSFTAISEPTGGSDPARAIRAVAARHGSKYVLNGRKMWTTHLPGAKYGVVFARTENGAGRSGISAFVLDADTPGLTHHQVPVIRDHWSNELLLEDVEIPVSSLVGEEGEGFKLTRKWTERGRLYNSSFAVGVADEAIRLAIDWVKTRETFGAPLATRQSAQFAIADSAVEVRAARLLLRSAASIVDAGGDAQAAVSMAKLFATESGFRVLDRMMQLFGGMGMAKDMPLEHWFRDLRVARIVEGPSEIHRYVVARELLGKVATAKPQWSG